MEPCCVGGEGRFPLCMRDSFEGIIWFLNLVLTKNKIFHKRWWRIKLTLISPSKPLNFAAPLFDLAQDEVVKEKAVEAAKQFFANRFVLTTWCLWFWTTKVEQNPYSRSSATSRSTCCPPWSRELFCSSLVSHSLLCSSRSPSVMMLIMVMMTMMMMMWVMTDDGECDDGGDFGDDDCSLLCLSRASDRLALKSSSRQQLTHIRRSGPSAVPG